MVLHGMRKIGRGRTAQAQRHRACDPPPPPQPHRPIASSTECSTAARGQISQFDAAPLSQCTQASSQENTLIILTRLTYTYIHVHNPKGPTRVYDSRETIPMCCGAVAERQTERRQFDWCQLHSMNHHLGSGQTQKKMKRKG